jgi:hypothetical protein
MKYQLLRSVVTEPETGLAVAGLRSAKVNLEIELTEMIRTGLAKI